MPSTPNCRNARRLPCPRAPFTYLSRGTILRPNWHRRSTCNQCGPMHLGARITSSSFAASTDSIVVMTCIASCIDASYLVLGLGDVLSRRARRDANRSAPSPGDHEIQSRAHLDTGERGGHRRRLHVRVRNGRPGRLPACWPDHAGLEHAPRHAHVRRGDSVGASLLRSDTVLSRHGSGIARVASRDSHVASSILASRQAHSASQNTSPFSRRLPQVFTEFKAIQSRAFREERERWAANDQDNASATLIEMPEFDAARPRCARRLRGNPRAADSKCVSGRRGAGATVSAGQKLVVLDAMKMELVIAAPSAGTVRKLLCKVGQMVMAGQQLLILATS